MTEAERTGQALAMLAAFELVGATRFALTLADLTGNKTDYRSHCHVDVLRGHISLILKKSASGKKNVIVRPMPASRRLVQLDDLPAATVERLRPVSFLAFCTSPGNFQAWIALGDADADFVRRVKIGVASDPSASGSTRICGSYNFKPKYAPDYPIVRTVHSAPGLVVAKADLLSRGLVAQAESAPNLPPRHASQTAVIRQRFPDYVECVRKAPRRKDGEADRSKADFFFCYLAAKWGFQPDAIAAELLRVSDKAQSKGAGYAILTARNAAANSRKHGGGGAG